MKTSDSRTSQLNPWRQVEHIDYSKGPKGGEYWWLTLECGHHKAVPISPLRPEFGLIVSFKETKRAQKKRTAPHRCRCLLCSIQAEKST